LELPVVDISDGNAEARAGEAGCREPAASQARVALVHKLLPKRRQ
jgi:hypothetical protein